jgi:hypothetical protein
MGEHIQALYTVKAANAQMNRAGGNNMTKGNMTNSNEN